MAATSLDTLADLRAACLTPGSLAALYDVGPILGKGGFSVVRLGTLKTEAGKQIALKILNPKGYLRDPAAARQIFHEIKVMQRVNGIGNANLMRLIAAHEDVSGTTGLPRLTIVTELYSGGELFDRIVGNPEKGIVGCGHYSEKDAALLMAKLGKAFIDIHKAGIIHRDLKPENVLYASKDAEAEPILADFGLAKLTDAAIDVHTGKVGTPGYMSPEIVLEQRYTEAGDVWALGVLLYILLCGYPPFYSDNTHDNNRELYRQIAAGVFEFHEPDWTAISAGAKDLVTKMLTVDTARRITMAQVLEHPWMREYATTHLPATLDNLKKFNARRKIKAAAAAVRLGARAGLRSDLMKELASSGKSSFPLSELEALNTEFLKIAGEGGSIPRSEFTAVMTRLGHGELPLDRIFAVLDEDGSGDVDYRELLAALARLRSDDHEAIRMCFKIFDTDGNGTLSMPEIVNLLRITGAGEDTEDPASSSSGASEGGAAAATGGAGASASAAVTDADAKAAALESLFARMDSNKDGQISFEEFKASVETEPALSRAIFRGAKRLASAHQLLPTGDGAAAEAKSS